MRSGSGYWKLARPSRRFLVNCSMRSIPWSQIARMRDHLAHRYFDTAHAILQATVDDDLPELERAVQSLTETLDDQTRAE